MGSLHANCSFRTYLIILTTYDKMTKNPCSVELFAALLPCCEAGVCKYGHEQCPPECREKARKYYRTHAIGEDGVGLDSLRGTAFEKTVTHIFEAFPGTRLISYGPEPEKVHSKNNQNPRKKR